MNKINIYDMENIISSYLTDKHPQKSNGFIIRLEDIIQNSYSRRRCYIIQFPLFQLDKQNIIYQIMEKFSQFAIEHIIDNYDLNHEFTIISIDPININKKITDIFIQYSGMTINPEDIIKSISQDIISQMNKRIIELYMDNNYPDIDIADNDQREEFNKIFDQIEINTIHDKYPYVDIYVPINFTKSNDDTNIMIYINGTIKTSTQVIDIIDNIRTCLDTDDTNEIFKYDKDEIVYKFDSNKEIKSFNFITDPDI
jgi:hypothetical protein